MDLSSYKGVLAQRGARTVLLLGALLRVPNFAIGVILSLHVVQTLGGGYADAGMLVMGQTTCLAISSPWRGHLLDRLGLRRVVLPAVAVAAVCWAVAPWVSYWPLFGLASLTGLISVPIWTVSRQALMAAVSEDHRRAALSLDASVTEVSFMIGPILAVLLASTWSTRGALFVFGMLAVALGLALGVINPALRGQTDAAAQTRVMRREWMGIHFASVLGIAGTTCFILMGTDIAVIAAVRHFDATAGLGLVLALWGAGSFLGGLIYGAWPRSVPSSVLLVGLALVTIPCALATGPVSLSVLCVIAGLLCAPTITATTDELSRIVPEYARGEAMGWHGAVMTAGGAIGSPLSGMFADRYGFGGGFLGVGLIGLGVAVAAAPMIVRSGARLVDPGPEVARARASAA